MTRWLSLRVVEAIHDEQLSLHGGPAGIRDLGLLESALARPMNLAAYGEPGLAELGATYAIAIARNHPFIDGNKRAGWMAMVWFLARNGVTFEPPDAEAAVAMLAMAAGEMTDAAFIEWVRGFAKPRA